MRKKKAMKWVITPETEKRQKRVNRIRGAPMEMRRDAAVQIDSNIVYARKTVLSMVIEIL